MKKILVFLFVISLFPACKGHEENNDNKNIVTPSNKSSTIKKTNKNYTIAQRDVFGDIKLSLDIRLKNKVSEEQLRQYALALKNNERKKYKRIFMCWYLSEMEIGAGAWATTHFNPNLKVKILGVTTEEEKFLINSEEDYKGIIIGKWLDNSARGKHTLIDNNGTIRMYIYFTDGSSYDKEMVESFKSNFLSYEDKDENDLGGYYLINENGELELHNNVGLIRTLRSIQ